MNSKRKGKVAELEFAKFLEARGFTARRGQQFSGNPDSPDVISSLPYHIEVKRVEALNLAAAVAQAERDAGPGKPWIVAHRRNGKPWLVTLTGEEFVRLVKWAKCEDMLDKAGVAP